MVFKTKSGALRLIQFILIIIFNYQFCNSQIYEVGLLVGKSYFIGDVGETKFINILTPKIQEDYLYGLTLKWNRSPRHSYRFSFISGELAANDLASKDPRRLGRGYKFSTPLREISLGMEFNFFDYNLHEYDVIFTPYLYSGLIYSKYNKQLLQNGVITDMSKKNSTFGIPIVIGMKYRFFDNFILSFEIGARYTFTDDIDASNVSEENFNYNFGNINNNDWYMFSIMNLSYTFGRQPCYCNIK